MAGVDTHGLRFRLIRLTVWLHDGLPAEAHRPEEPLEQQRLRAAGSRSVGACRRRTLYDQKVDRPYPLQGAATRGCSSGCSGSGRSRRANSTVLVSKLYSPYSGGTGTTF